MRANLACKCSVARDAQATIDAFHDALEENADRPAVFFASDRPRRIRSRLEAYCAATNAERRFWNDEMRQEMSDYLAAAAAQVAQWDLSKLTFSEFADMLAKTYRRARGSIRNHWDGRPKPRICMSCGGAWSSIVIRWN